MMERQSNASFPLAVPEMPTGAASSLSFLRPLSLKYYMVLCSTMSKESLVRLRLVEKRIDDARARYDRTGELCDLAVLRDEIKRHRALRGIPYEVP